MHSIFAAENAVTSGHFESINLFPQDTNDLAQQAKTHWMTHWPPVHSWLYALLMWPGVSPSASTKFLGFASILVGGIGWIRLTKFLGGSRACITVIALGYPWISFIARTYIDYRNDHLACALIPWVYLTIIHIARSPGQIGWIGLSIRALLVGATVLVKYSLVPVVGAAGLYFFWVEARQLSITPDKVFRVSLFSVALLLPE